MAANPVLLFLIVGKNEPLYEAEITKRGISGNTDTSVARQSYFVVHSSLDLVDRATWSSQNMYLKVVDKVNQQYVSTFLTAGNIKFLLLHSGKSEDTIKIFFQEVHELYVQLSMNPFYRYDTPITSKEFDKRVRNVARRLV
ncbi:putative spondyloepiphyseal dysplasia [Fragilariopsis cylindrus CCMP1102]|uniref:Putative spondyloepiphyseal dysplasia n=1 Tax=Fragilariopsis cylindrus CCMP1102 TaxID=635003 RepID=A0A1E7EU74_9STRA|nr:putative spondyloepiphyseal dysplasia [Fragilariopsis cylindrus CCMP1102]|eukprot:OEU09355.1 putative spondyloepiphyseal dysplasia [Fragilariopsis cylindrus CCMP1102]